MSKIDVKLVRAFDLPLNDDEAPPNAFVKVTVNGSEPQITAATDGKTTSPYFRDAFIFSGATISPTGPNTVKFEVFNKDLFAGDELLCSGTFSIEQSAKMSDDDVTIDLSVSPAKLVIRCASVNEEEIKKLQGGLDQGISSEMKKSVSSALAENTVATPSAASSNKTKETTAENKPSAPSSARAPVTEKKLSAPSSARASAAAVAEKKAEEKTAVDEKQNNTTTSTANAPATSTEAASQQKPRRKRQEDPNKTPLERVRAKLMDDELRKILVNFDSFDKNGDGVLDKTELTSAVKSALDGNFSSESAIAQLVDDIIAAADSDNDGKISVKELRSTFALDDCAGKTASKPPGKTPLQRVRAKLMDNEIKKILVNFNTFDKNGDGVLDQNELTTAVNAAVNGNFSNDKAIEQLVQDMIAAADADNDGKISVKELRSTFLLDELTGATTSTDGVRPSSAAATYKSTSAQKQQETSNTATPSNSGAAVPATATTTTTNANTDATTTSAVAVAAVGSQEQQQKPRRKRQEDPNKTPLERVRAKLMDDELRKILVNFDSFDKNGDGVLDKTELTSAVKSALDGNFSSESAIAQLVDDIIAAADSDNDGKISVKELRTTFALDDCAGKTASKPAGKTPLQRVRAKLMDNEIKKILVNFNTFDKNGDGVLDQNELTTAVNAAVNGNFSNDKAIEQLVQDMIAAADADNDGKISVNELRSTFLLDELTGATTSTDGVRPSSAAASYTNKLSSSSAVANNNNNSYAAAAMTTAPAAAATTTASSTSNKSSSSSKREIRDLSEFPEEKRETLVKCFGIFDVDGNGTLNPSESLAAFLTFFPTCSASKLRKKIKEADLNNDGNLDINEFARIAVKFM